MKDDGGEISRADRRRFAGGDTITAVRIATAQRPIRCPGDGLSAVRSVFAELPEDENRIKGGVTVPRRA